MKTLYVVRHAKSSWKEKGIDDFDRPLNDRGERDAPFMGELLNSLGCKFDLVLSSPAKRAQETAKIICSKIGYNEEKIVFKRELYLANVKEIATAISEINKEVESLAIFGHNPGLTEFPNYLSGENSIDNIPTCGIVKFELFIENWKSISKGIGKIRMFEYPKKYFK